MAKIVFFVLFIVNFNISILYANGGIKDFIFIGIYKNNGKAYMKILDKNETIFKDVNISFAILKSQDSSIDSENISRYRDYFKPIEKDKIFQDSNSSYWVKVDLGNKFPTGRFICTYSGIRVLEDTFTNEQSADKFNLNNYSHIAFSYRKGIDKSIYYFKIELNRDKSIFLHLATSKRFFSDLSYIQNIKFIAAIVLGFILLAGIYNGALYYYNRDIAHLYYALLQLFMLLFLGAEIFILGITKDIDLINIYFKIAVLLIALVTVLFTISFLEVKKYIPLLYYLFIGIIILILVDFLITLTTHNSFIYENSMVGYLMLPLLIAGFIRIKQGYKPAYFYLLGWTLLTITVFLKTYNIGLKYIFDPVFFGAAAEAILFSLALSYKIKIIKLEQQKQNELLIHQNKLAAMGEMLGNIAHQWRQPLTHLSLILMNLKEAYRYKELTKEYLDKKLDDANKQLQFMSETIDCFTEFYTPKKEKQKFYISEAVSESIEIMENTIAKANIDIKVLIKNNFLLNTYKNELKQVLVNIILNSKDAFKQREIQNPKIVITTTKNSLIIEDNGGGISDDVIDKIFEPYFSTKVGSSGVGLYMSKTIIEHHLKAQLNVTNIKDGVRFEIIFNIDGEA